MLADLPLPDLSNVTATAILGWYAWHTVSKTIPGIVEAFREEAATMRSECRLERETLYQELAAERCQRHADHMAIIEALDDLARRMLSASASRTTS
ncbi:MAG TPA: hypothetical protein VG713_08875 [Pirellulales bacterium]|jgi:hypothetical protein|nr:hypothetical protein [Pirellulales bacterium]